jgi:hypothetical protein
MDTTLALFIYKLVSIGSGLLVCYFGREWISRRSLAIITRRGNGPRMTRIVTRARRPFSLQRGGRFREGIGNGLPQNEDHNYERRTLISDLS